VPVGRGRARLARQRTGAQAVTVLRHTVLLVGIICWLASCLWLLQESWRHLRGRRDQR